MLVFLYFSQIQFRSWFDGQIVIDGKGISCMDDSLFSINITLGLLIQIFIKYPSENAVTVVAQMNVSIQNVLE